MSGVRDRGERMSGDGAPSPLSPASQPQVNPEYLQMLCDMGIDRALATQVRLIVVLEVIIRIALKVYGPITYGFFHRSGVFDIR